MKIIVIGNFGFSQVQTKRLEVVGEVTYVDNPKTSQEWLQLVQGFDVICSDGFGIYDNLYNLRDVFVTYPYIEIGDFDSEKLKEKNVFIANAKGCNRDSVAEWAIFMIIGLLRKLPTYLNIEKESPFVLIDNMKDVNILLIGKGNINMRIGELCKAFNMKVDYFSRNDNLLDKASNADLLINGLSSTKSSKNLLNEEFFRSLKKGSYFISYVRRHTYDADAMVKSLDDNILAGAGIDTDSKKLFDTTDAFYDEMLKHEKVWVTPHIAGVTRQDFENGDEVIVRNIEAWITGKKENIINKK